jgi:hypothetical protein
VLGNSIRRLAELGEHTKGGLRMQKCDKFVRGTFKRHLMDQPDSLLPGPCQLAGDVVGGECEVVNSRAGFFEKFGDRAIVGSGFEQLDMDVTRRKKGGPDFLRLHFLTTLTGQAENVLVVGDGFIERSDGDSEVVDFGDHFEWGGTVGTMIAGIGGLAPQGVAKAVRILFRLLGGGEARSNGAGRSLPPGVP